MAGIQGVENQVVWLVRVVYYPTVELVKFIVRSLRETYPDDYIVIIKSIDDILSAAKWCRLRARSVESRILWYAAYLFYYFITITKRCAVILVLWFLKKNSYYVYKRNDMYGLALNTAIGEKSKEDVYKWLVKHVRRPK